MFGFNAKAQVTLYKNCSEIFKLADEFALVFNSCNIDNIESLRQQYDPVTNEKLYEIIIYSEDGMPSREIIKESDLKKRSSEEQERARPYIEWEGQPMEGMA